MALCTPPKMQAVVSDSSMFSRAGSREEAVKPGVLHA